MSSPTEVITHPGIVLTIENDVARVMIQSVAACGSCTAKGSCSMAEMEEKIIDIPISESDNYKKGDAVIISMKPSSGRLAVFLGYFLPFLLVVTVLIVSLSAGLEQGLAGLFSLLILGPYYLTLFWLRHKVSRNFTFNMHPNPSFIH